MSIQFTLAEPWLASGGATENQLREPKTQHKWLLARRQYADAIIYMII
jgi:hypothetical protein